MLKITPNPTFVADAEIHVPGADVPGSIKVTFKYLDAEQIRSWQGKHGKNSAYEALHEIIVTWSGVEDEAGNAIEFSAEHLKQLLAAYQTAGEDLIKAFFKELFGARRKN